MEKMLGELFALDFPIGQYALFGSAPMGIRKIRKVSNDLDLIAKKELFESLKKKYGLSKLKGKPVYFIKIGKNIEVFNSWNLDANIDSLIDSAEIINGFPFVRLKYVLEWKMNSKRPKDIKDARLIKKYLEKKLF